MPTRLRLPDNGPGSGAWWAEQLDWSNEVRKTEMGQWRHNLRAYRDKLIKPRAEAIRVNIEFEKTEEKKPQLLYRLPALKLKPHPRSARDRPPDEMRRAIAIFKEVLTHLIGPSGAHLKATMDEVIFDVLCPAGLGFVKLGYERYEDGVVPVKIGMQPDPAFIQPGSVLGLGPEAPQVPIYQSAPNVIAERYYASRISPARALIPADFMHSDYSADADWLGHDFFISEMEATRRKWPIPPEMPRGSDENEDEDRLVNVARSGMRGKDQFHCREVFFYASRVDRDIIHPQHIRRIVFVVGSNDPIVYEDYAHQRFDGRGRLVGGIGSLPIKVLALRYVSDCPYPPSDCTITSQQGNELSEFRTQTIIHRRKAVPMRWMDVHAIIDDKIKALIDKGEYYDIIPTDGPGDRLLGEIARAAYPRENYTANDQIMQDVNRMWALGANQASVRETAGTTATEISAIREATQSRLGAEREKVVSGFFVSLVEGLAALVQLYADREDFVEIVGETGTREIEAWDRATIQGEYLFSVLPDSSAMPDARADRELALNRYNLLANDPFINREQLVRETVEAFEGDPDRLVRAPAPAAPEKPRISLAIRGDDLNPMAPQYPNVVNLLVAAGIPANLPTGPAPPGEDETKKTRAAGVVDRERLRMSEADVTDGRAGGLISAGGL